VRLVDEADIFTDEGDSDAMAFEYTVPLESVSLGRMTSTADGVALTATLNEKTKYVLVVVTYAGILVSETVLQQAVVNDVAVANT
jgi:hypothetical protein